MNFYLDDKIIFQDKLDSDLCRDEPHEVSRNHFVTWINCILNIFDFLISNFLAIVCSRCHVPVTDRPFQSDPFSMLLCNVFFFNSVL